MYKIIFCGIKIWVVKWTEELRDGVSFYHSRSGAYTFHLDFLHINFFSFLFLICLFSSMVQFMQLWVLILKHFFSLITSSRTYIYNVSYHIKDKTCSWFSSSFSLMSFCSLTGIIDIMLVSSLFWVIFISRHLQLLVL